MEYTKVEFTDEQRKELIRLMVGLNFVELKTKFNMNIFSGKQNGELQDIEPNEAMNQCGASACALGHATFFCTTKPCEKEDWKEYGERIFNIKRPIEGVGSWRFLFIESWSNSWEQAVARMYIILTKGVPNNFGWRHYPCWPKYRKPSDLIIENYALEYGVTVDEVYDRACALTT